MRHTEGRLRVRRGVLTASNRLDNGAFGGRAEIKLPVGHREEVATPSPHSTIRLCAHHSVLRPLVSLRDDDSRKRGFEDRKSL